MRFVNELEIPQSTDWILIDGDESRQSKSRWHSWVIRYFCCAAFSDSRLIAFGVGAWWMSPRKIRQDQLRVIDLLKVSLKLISSFVDSPQVSEQPCLVENNQWTMKSARHWTQLSSLLSRFHSFKVKVLLRNELNSLESLLSVLSHFFLRFFQIFNVFESLDLTRQFELTNVTKSACRWSDLSNCEMSGKRENKMRRDSRSRVECRVIIERIKIKALIKIP